MVVLRILLMIQQLQSARTRLYCGQGLARSAVIDFFLFAWPSFRKEGLHI